jgi:hypothetical protein
MLEALLAARPLALASTFNLPQLARQSAEIYDNPAPIRFMLVNPGKVLRTPDLQAAISLFYVKCCKQTTYVNIIRLINQGFSCPGPCRIRALLQQIMERRRR